MNIDIVMQVKFSCRLNLKSFVANVKSCHKDQALFALLSDGDGSDVLLEVGLPLISSSQCSWLIGGFTDNMICAGKPEGVVDTCSVRIDTRGASGLFIAKPLI